MSIKSKGKKESKGHEEKEREMRKGVEFLAASGLVWRLQRMTQQRIVSAHALLRVCWLFAGMSLCESHARRGFMHRVPLPSPARGQRRPEPGRARTHTHKAGPAHWCGSHAVTLLLREEREREITVRRRGVLD